MALRSFTLSELALYNGRKGAPAYVAYQGLVYDLSTSYQWRGGRHWAAHTAGHDLTTELADAPHGEDLLMQFPVVGTFITEF